jgi:hypothetical protein
VPNTEFEGGGDGHGYGDCTFLVKKAQPSHRSHQLDPILTPLTQPDIFTELRQNQVNVPIPKKKPLPLANDHGR